MRVDQGLEAGLGFGKMNERQAYLLINLKASTRLPMIKSPTPMAIHLPALDAGLSWNTGSLYTTGTITVIPEPNVAALIGGFGMLALLRRRRN